MDTDRQRPEPYGDFSDARRNTHSSTSDGLPPPPPPHPPLDSGNGDYHHQQRPHHHHRHHSNPSYNHQHNFNSEQHGSSPAGGPDDNPGHFPRKRPFLSSDCIEGGSFVKLYVGGIPRTSTQEEVRSLFEEYGRIVEVVRLKDNRTYQPHECGFVKYATIEEADRAIGALDNKYTFPAGVAPIKVRYADGERERLGAPMKVRYADEERARLGAPIKVRYADGERERLGALGTQNCKVYVGCLNKQASKREIEEIFSPYGLVESVYIVFDEVKQSRGCGFIQFSHRDMAVAAINALNGTYIMRGCDQPLVVRFAEPKKPRIGEPRDGCKYIGSRPQEYVRPAPHVNGPRTGHHLPDASLPLSPKTMVSSSQSPGTGGKPPTASRTSSASELVFASTANPSDCDWSEHTCPDGYKYYYNCETYESRWEKPEEYLLFEQKQLPRQMQLSSHQLALDQMPVQAATTPTSVIISPTCV